MHDVLYRVLCSPDTDAHPNAGVRPKHAPERHELLLRDEFPAPYWQCLCFTGGAPANYKIQGYVNGCPSGTYNDGRDCCFPIAPTPTPTPVSGGCTTPGWNGSCPPGTYPNNGMCCTGGCDGAAVAASGATATFSAEPSQSVRARRRHGWLQLRRVGGIQLYQQRRTLGRGELQL